MNVFKKNFFPLVLFLLIIIAFILLQPTSVSSLNLNNRQAQWNSFIKQVDGKRMDTKRFWQTREFYSPGQFIYKKEGITSAKQELVLKQLGLSYEAVGNPFVVLEYSAPAFISNESLVSEGSSGEILQSIKSLAGTNEVIAKGENFVIIKTQPDKAVLIFLATPDEMKRTNGFFKYEEDDKELVKSKSWLDVSEVTLN